MFRSLTVERDCNTRLSLANLVDNIRLKIFEHVVDLRAYCYVGCCKSIRSLVVSNFETAAEAFRGCFSVFHIVYNNLFYHGVLEFKLLEGDYSFIGTINNTRC
jgi:hypothetical protein